MSHRISKKRARTLRDNELELQQMQREGKPLPKSDRRHKKYLMQIRKQQGFFKYLRARYKQHGSKIPEHLKEEK